MFLGFFFAILFLLLTAIQFYSSRGPSTIGFISDALG